jgi:hypothetical protein
MSSYRKSLELELCSSEPITTTQVYFCSSLGCGPGASHLLGECYTQVTDSYSCSICFGGPKDTPSEKFYVCAGLLSLPEEAEKSQSASEHGCEVSPLCPSPGTCGVSTWSLGSLACSMPSNAAGPLSRLCLPVPPSTPCSKVHSPQHCGVALA